MSSNFKVAPEVAETMKEASAFLKDIWEKANTKSAEINPNDKDKNFVCVIPNDDYDKVMKYLKRTNVWRIHYDNDAEPTLFKMKDGQLRAYDSLFPQGRPVEKTSCYMNSFESDGFVPTSLRGTLDYIVCKFNGTDGYSDTNIGISRWISSKFPKDDSNRLVLLWTTFFLYAHKHKVILAPGPIKDCFGLAVPSDIDKSVTDQMKALFEYVLKATLEAETA